MVPFRKGVSRAAAERRIRAIAADTSSLIVPWTVAKQIVSAEITLRQVIATLRSGAVAESPTRNEQGDWLCTLRRRAGGQNVQVTVALADDDTLILVGARWVAKEV